MELIVRVPGSCGEIMQGSWQGEPFLVTCPIDRYSTVTIRPGTGQLLGGGTKAETAFALAKTYCRAANLAYDFILTSALPQGKGMASSSADVCAVLAAVGLVSGRQLSEQEIGRLAASIEPTDGIFCRGLAVINPDTGIIKTVLGPVPKLSIAVFDAGGTVDTVAFHERGRRGLSDSKAIEAGMALLQQPLTPERVGKAAFEKPGVVGVNTAHSGTVAGVFFTEGEGLDVEEGLVRPLAAAFPGWTYVDTVHLQEGGIFMERR